MKLSKFTHDFLLWALIAATVLLVVISAIVRDYAFIKNHPKSFIFETLVVSIAPSLVLAFVLFKTRNVKVKDTIVWFSLMVLKFAAFHVLFQLSGIYTVLFSSV